MQTDLKTAANACAGTTLRHFVAACTVAMLLLCSALQATHLHSAPHLGKRHAGVEVLAAAIPSGSDAGCLLCVSASTALPARPPSTPRVLIAFREVVASPAGRLVPTEVQFNQFTRPPPGQPSENFMVTTTAGHRTTRVPCLHCRWFEQGDVSPSKA